ncbi:TPA: hypothetical protein RZ072_003381 [Klebsiella pneumoniae]|nr:hypothetical protein [Klebsiella pneumoniae]
MKITELTQRMKAAAVRAKTATEEYASGHMSVSVCFAECEEFNRLTDGPDNIIALVEALEKAQAENTAGVAGMAESYETTISMLRSRIAELESRAVTVKLPQAVSAGGQGYQGQVERILTAAGIKVEAE